MLVDGGSVFDVVIVVVWMFEDCLLFNVGCGVVYMVEGKYEFDVVVMDGVMFGVGVICCVICVCNLVFVVWCVMEVSEYVLFVGVGVDVFVVV